MKANLTTTLSFLATLAIAAVTTGSDSLEGRADTPTPTVSPTPSPAPFSDVESSSSSAAPDEKATRQMELWLFLYDLDGEKGGFVTPDGRAIIPSGEYSEYQFEGSAPQQSPYLGWVYDTTKANGTPFPLPRLLTAIRIRSGIQPGGHGVASVLPCSGQGERGGALRHLFPTVYRTAGSIHWYRHSSFDR